MPRSERSLKRKQKEAQEIASKCRKLTNFYGSKLKTDIKGTEEKEIGASSHPDSPQAEEIESQDINNPQQSTHTVQTQKTASVFYYHGIKLDLKFIIESFPELQSYTAKKNVKKRLHVVCNLCKEYLDVAKKYSRNGKIGIANGVRADDEERLKLMIDHVFSEMHKAKRDQKQLELMWEEKSSNHPWLNGFKKANTNVVKFLVNMAYYLYNDCLCETISAHSWPARSLTTLAATRLISLMEDEGPDAVLPEFKPTNAELHYRDPMCYRDMLSSVQAIELQKVKKMFLECIVYSIQIDGNVSKHMRDHKFVSSTMSMTNGDRRTVFMVMHSPEERRAHGLLKTVNQALKVCEANEDKLVGITTDGEAANTGRNAGLWKLLGDQLERNIFTFWCCAHRSDLATEAIINSVPELKIWKSSLIGVATYFRTSTSKKKMLEKAAIEMKQFPRHHDVRFAQRCTVSMAQRKLDLLSGTPYPGKCESKTTLPWENIQTQRARQTHNTLVPTNRRNESAIRIEITSSAKNFLSERLHPEQEEILLSMSELLSASTLGKFVEKGIGMTQRLFPGEEGRLAAECCEQWDKIEKVPHLPEGSDIGCKLSVRLRKLLPITDGTVQKVLAAIGSMSPHSMQTERMVSHQNIIVEDSRTNKTEDTINARLLIALNGVGTAHYDPRPAVAHFLSARERRNRQPDFETYSRRKFVRKFFRQTGHF